MVARCSRQKPSGLEFSGEVGRRRVGSAWTCEPGKRGFPSRAGRERAPLARPLCPSARPLQRRERGVCGGAGPWEQVCAGQKVTLPGLRVGTRDDFCSLRAEANVGGTTGDALLRVSGPGAPSRGRADWGRATGCPAPETSLTKQVMVSSGAQGSLTLRGVGLFVVG